jgi:hypothetical protein
VRKRLLRSGGWVRWRLQASQAYPVGCSEIPNINTGSATDRLKCVRSGLATAYGSQSLMI